MPHHNPRPLYETGPGFEPGTSGLADECSTTELNPFQRIDLAIPIFYKEKNFNLPRIIKSLDPSKYIAIVCNEIIDLPY